MAPPLLHPARRAGRALIAAAAAAAHSAPALPAASLQLMAASPFDRIDSQMAAFDELARRMDADMDAAFGRMDRCVAFVVCVSARACALSLCWRPLAGPSFLLLSRASYILSDVLSCVNTHI